MNDPLCYLLMVGAPGRDVTGYALPLLLFRPPPQESASRKRHSIELRGAANLEASARRGAAAAYALLWNERIVQRSIELGLEVALPALAGGRVPLAEGDSATLAFALGFMAATTGQRNYPKFAATGFVRGDGRVSTFVDHDSNDYGDLEPSGSAPRQRIQGIPLKLEAAVSALGRGSWVFYPQDAEEEVEQRLKVRARQAGVVLCPIEHLSDAAEALGIEVSQIHLKSPFRGLEAFEYEHRSIYFGRQGDIKEFCDLLDTRERFDMPSLVVLGASGRGKSSFVQAGVVPELKRRHRSRKQSELDFVVWRPGEIGSGGGSVVQSVLQACRQQLPLPEGDPVDFGPEPLADYLVQHLKGSGWRLLLLVDQTEELFTQYVAPEALTQLGKLFCALQTRGVSVICTLRDDFYTQFATHPSLGRAFARTAQAPNGFFHLGPLLPADLRQVIEAPVEALGYTFEAHPQRGTLLSAQILAECLENAGTDTLPLVQFSLEQLFRKALSRGDRTIRWVDYDGGLSHAVAWHAAAAVDALPPDVREALPWLARKLTVIDGRGNANARPFRLKTGTSRQAGHSSLVERLASPASRLLVVADLGRGELQVRLAHEALLQHWGALKQEVETCRSDIELSDALERDAMAWAGGAVDALWRGKRLQQARSLQRRLGEELGLEVSKFVNASHVLARRKLGLVLAGIVVTLIIVASIGATAMQRREAEIQLSASSQALNQVQEMLAHPARWDDRRAIIGILVAHALHPREVRRSDFYQALFEVSRNVKNMEYSIELSHVGVWSFSATHPDIIYIVNNGCLLIWSIPGKGAITSHSIHTVRSSAEQPSQASSRELGGSETSVLSTIWEYVLSEAQDSNCVSLGRNRKVQEAGYTQGYTSSIHAMLDEALVALTSRERQISRRLLQDDTKSQERIALNEKEDIVKTRSGKHLELASSEGSGRRETRRNYWIGGFDSHISDLQISADSAYVAASAGSELRIWSLSESAFTSSPGQYTFRPRVVSQPVETPSSVDCMGDTAIVSVNSHSTKVLCRDLVTNTLEMKELTPDGDGYWYPKTRWTKPDVLSYVLTPSRTTLAKWKVDGSFAAVDTNTGKPHFTFRDQRYSPRTHRIVDISASPDGSRIAAILKPKNLMEMDYAEIIVWDSERGALSLPSVRRADWAVSALAFMSNEVLTYGDSDGKVTVWNLQSEASSRTLNFEGPITSLVAENAKTLLVTHRRSRSALNSTGDSAILVDLSGTLRRTSLRTADFMLRIDPPPVFHGNGRFISIVEWGGALLTFDTATGALLQGLDSGFDARAFVVSGSNDAVFSIADRIVSGSGTVIDAHPILNGLVDTLCGKLTAEIDAEQFWTFAGYGAEPQRLCVKSRPR